MTFTQDLEVWHKAAFFEAGDCDHSDLEYFLDDGWHTELRVVDLTPVTHKMIKIVHIADLARNGDTFLIFGSHCAVVDKSFSSCFTKT